MKIRVHRFGDDSKTNDMIVIRDESGTVFTACHMDLFWEDREKGGFHDRLLKGEEIIFELVET